MNRSRYSFVERAIHWLSFNNLEVQHALSGIEEKIFPQSCLNQECKEPVFITSLPRCGTTLLLQLLSGLEEFSPHTYRNMPFILCPLLWDAISRPFFRGSDYRERMHGDGVLISYDSPEAFDEIIWMYHWREKYHENYIDTWEGGDRKADFEEFLIKHINKIIYCNMKYLDSNIRFRYLSKNNSNLARIKLLSNIFPDSFIVVPFRSPLQHCASLANQHNKFLNIHSDDEFSRLYMMWIGHFDFGMNFRPLNFDNWYCERDYTGGPDSTFWLKYWKAAFHEILSNKTENVIFVDYELLCRNAEHELGKLFSRINITSRVDKGDIAGRIIAPESHAVDHLCNDKGLIDECFAIYDELKQQSV